MAEEKKISVAEERKTISTTIAAAFGFVNALLSNQEVQGGLAAAGVSTTAPKDWAGWAYFVVTAVILTVVLIVFIFVIGRWGSKE